MIYISELLPNPSGKDTEGEWIELCSSGTSDEYLAGLKLQNTKGKTFVFPDIKIEPYGCVAFMYSETKITLTNTGGELYIINQNGKKIDTAKYSGTFKDDVSAMRINPTSEFLMSSTPTKGYANKLTAIQKVSAIDKDYEVSIPNALENKVSEKINNEILYIEAIIPGMITVSILMIIFWYCFKKIYIEHVDEFTDI